MKREKSGRGSRNPTSVQKLKALDSDIKDAWVSLALPEPSVFIGDKEKEKPTASVTVVPRNTLTPKQVQGIVMMVARSVEKS